MKNCVSLAVFAVAVTVAGCNPQTETATAPVAVEEAAVATPAPVAEPAVDAMADQQAVAGDVSELISTSEETAVDESAASELEPADMDGSEHQE
jgi:hypothetical protein